MAEGVLFDVAGSLVEMLVSAAFEEIGLLYGVKDEFQKLVETTGVIKGVLLDAEDKMAVDESVKAWLKQLGDAFFVADDLVDKFRTKLLQRKLMSGDKFTRSGSLTIEGLSHTHRATSKGVICEGKHNLHSLTLKLNVVKNDEMSIEGLQPPSSLEELNVWDFKGVTFAGWDSSWNNLVKLKLFRCKKCQYLLKLDQLCSLEVFEIDGFEAEYMCSSAEDDDFDTNLFFPSLVTLRIVDCLNLEWWWWKKEVDGNNIRSFPRLSSLTIINCPNFTSMPLFPSIKEVRLYKTSSMALEDTFKMMRGRKAHNTHPNISLLRSIKIEDCPNLTSILEGIDNLPSLESIHINHCCNLISLLEGIDNLPSFESIYIEDCPNLTSIPNNFRKVKNSFIKNCPKLEER